MNRITRKNNKVLPDLESDTLTPIQPYMEKNTPTAIPIHDTTDPGVYPELNPKAYHRPKSDKIYDKIKRILTRRSSLPSVEDEDIQVAHDNVLSIIRHYLRSTCFYDKESGNYVGLEDYMIQLILALYTDIIYINRHNNVRLHEQIFVDKVRMACKNIDLLNKYPSFKQFLRDKQIFHKMILQENGIVKDIVTAFANRSDYNSVYNEILSKLRDFFGDHTKEFINMDNNYIPPLGNSSPVQRYSRLSKQLYGGKRIRKNHTKKPKNNPSKPTKTQLNFQ